MRRTSRPLERGPIVGRETRPGLVDTGPNGKLTREARRQRAQQLTPDLPLNPRRRKARPDLDTYRARAYLLELKGERR
jgi:hypothetical protein